ncbi:hypothetical protein EDB83DRAFT_2528519 [Lactarius deliciosus]|nr:hypothetical protein EDB83DRAFT_2528519 [Lactarius deliciosus]
MGAKRQWRRPRPSSASSPEPPAAERIGDLNRKRLRIKFLDPYSGGVRSGRDAAPDAQSTAQNAEAHAAVANGVPTPLTQPSKRGRKRAGIPALSQPSSAPPPPASTAPVAWHALLTTQATPASSTITDNTPSQTLEQHHVHTGTSSAPAPLLPSTSAWYPVPNAYHPGILAFVLLIIPLLAPDTSPGLDVVDIASNASWYRAQARAWTRQGRFGMAPPAPWTQDVLPCMTLRVAFAMTLLVQGHTPSRSPSNHPCIHGPRLSSEERSRHSQPTDPSCLSFPALRYPRGLSLGLYFTKAVGIASDASAGLTVSVPSSFAHILALSPTLALSPLAHLSDVPRGLSLDRLYFTNIVGIASEVSRCTGLDLSRSLHQASPAPSVSPHVSRQPSAHSPSLAHTFVHRSLHIPTNRFIPLLLLAHQYPSSADRFIPILIHRSLHTHPRPSIASYPSLSIDCFIPLLVH